PPANDDFADREVLSGALPIEITRSNVEATKEEGEYFPTIGAAGHSIWFEWEAPSTEFISIGTCGTEFPTLIGIFTGTELTNLTSVTNGNASEGPDCLDAQRQYTFKATAGTKYVIAVDGDSFTGPETIPVQTEGEIALRIMSTPIPANDDFAAAATINGQTHEEPGGKRTYFANIRGYNWNATIETGEPKDEDVSGASVWYRWTAPESGTYRIGEPCCGGNLSRTVYSGDSLELLTPFDPGTGFPGVPISAGTTLWIRIGGIPDSETEEPATASFNFFIFGELPSLPKPELPVVPPPLPPTPDVTPPVTSIAKRKIKPGKRTAKFWLASSEVGNTFLCRLDGRKFAPCGAVKSYKNLKPGRHVFKVKAVDAAGNVDATPAVARFKVPAPQRRR
nr:hypothetical protein [Actinomycetota bacterium]